jgi:hypothetical protein
MKSLISAKRPQRLVPARLAPLAAHTARQREQRDQAKQNGGRRVAGEQPEKAVLGQKTRRRRAERPTQR